MVEPLRLLSSEAKFWLRPLMAVSRGEVPTDGGVAAVGEPEGEPVPLERALRTSYKLWAVA